MYYVLLFIIAILPVVLLGIYINSKDNEKEPKTLLVGLFSAGILSCVLVLLISALMEKIFPFFGRDLNKFNYFELLLYTFIGISLVEEGCKWFFTTIIGYKNRNFDEAYDIIVYATFVSLGFASIENLLYVYNGNIVTGILRALTSVPGHVCFGITMGYYLLLAKIAKKNNNRKLHIKNLILSILIPIIEHGLYDFCAFSKSTILMLLLLSGLVVFFILSHNKIKVLSGITEKVRYDNKYCPNCGKEVSTLFCSNCGNKNK